MMTREEVGLALRQLREQNNMTQNQVATLLGRKQQSLNHWETGYSQPNLETLVQLLEIYGIANIFTARPAGETLLSEREKLLLSAYRRAPSLLRDAAYRILSPEPPSTVQIPAQKTAASATRELPVYQMPRFGSSDPFLEGDLFELIVPDRNIPAGATMGVRVRGDSMSPMFEDGQIAWVRRQRDLAPWQVGLFLRRGDPLIRRLTAKNGPGPAYLTSVNPDYPPIPVLPEEQIRILGRVLG